MSNRFSIVIPSRNPANVIACVRAIRQAGEIARIIIVDDFPYPGTDLAAMIRDAELDLSRDLIQTGADPFIFARNVNIGIRAAGEDDVLLLNDDALLQTSLGFSMLHLMSQNPEYGIVSAACNNVGNVNQHYRREDKALRPEARMLCFIAVMIPRRTINAVGLLDEIFVGGGFEDDDYCLRTRRAGLKLGIFDGCFVDHAHLTSTFRGAGGPGYGKRNAEIFREKWGAGNHDL